ncbi:hypothetical protein M413DRAFT_448426 [Hebeloma cylindrosporum]|uniref:Uncharacterized protein n=1 Tax=Hebeloma cylindrosporum TaxID=76867 RepID=A0A0C3C214_HEBCY|nr:hypothetical protein M413DRAFT_448426 [Hebeloma cylindrosporum h7]
MEAMARDAGAVQFYLSKGGKVVYVLDAAMEISWEQSNLGDWTFDHDESDEGGEYMALVRCFNDLEFGLVRRKIGLSPGGMWGPYQDREKDEGVEVDEEEYKEDEDWDWY